MTLRVRRTQGWYVHDTKTGDYADGSHGDYASFDEAYEVKERLENIEKGKT